MNTNPSNPENGDHLLEKDFQNDNDNNLNQELVQSQLNENQRHDQAENEEMLQPENDNLMENIPADDIPQNQDHSHDHAEEELQQNQDEEENNNEAAPPENTIASLISSVSNSHLMSEENIEAIREVLCKKENVFYKLSPRDENLQEELQAIIKWKAKIAENTIGQALNYYHQKLLDSELNHLDKLMRILKSNRREMYLRRLPAESHEHDEPSEEHDSPDASPSQQERISGIGGDHGGNHENTAINKASKGKNVTLRDLLPEYDPQKKFIRFQLNDKYEVYLKAFEQKGVRKGSLIDRIPQDVLQNHIFIYFNSFDLFKIRAVCSEWREFIRGMWHIIFRREMMEQVIAADLCNDIEMNFKLMGVKSPFYQKFGIFMKAISEIIDWDVFLGSLQTDTVDIKVKMLVITFFRMIGMYVGFDKLSDYNEVYWNHFKEIASNHLKTFIDSLFHQDFQFKSNYELDLMKENFLDCPDISSFSVRQSDDKNAIMFQLFLRQLLVFAQLKNYISLAQSYIIMAKDKLKEVSKEWPHKKDFLEGAYKILLFKFIEIRNGEVTIVKEDSDRRTGLLRNIQDELDECMHITTRIHEQSDQNHGESEPHMFSQGTQIKPSSNLEESKEGYGEILQDKEQHELGQVSDKEETLGTLIANEFDQKLKQEQHDSNRIQEENLNEKDRIQEQASNEIPEGKPSVKCAYHDDTRNRFDLEGQLAKIIELKNNSSDIAYEKFIKSQDPDYVIKRNGSETRLYLDDLIKVEFLIQKVLKQHLIRQRTECSCPAHADENGDENEEGEGEVMEEKEDVIQVSEQDNNDNENQPL